MKKNYNSNYYIIWTNYDIKFGQYISDYINNRKDKYSKSSHSSNFDFKNRRFISILLISPFYNEGT